MIDTNFGMKTKPSLHSSLEISWFQSCIEIDLTKYEQELRKNPVCTHDGLKKFIIGFKAYLLKKFRKLKSMMQLCVSIEVDNKNAKLFL